MTLTSERFKLLRGAAALHLNSMPENERALALVAFQLAEDFLSNVERVANALEEIAINTRSIT